MKGAALPMDFWVGFVQMARRLQVDPYELAAVINLESAGFNPHAQNKQGGRVVAQGLNQLIKSTATKALGMSEELWENFSKLSPMEHLKWTEKYFRMFGTRARGKDAGELYLLNFGGYNNPDGSLYAGKEAQEQYKKLHPDAVFKNPEYQQKAIEQNKGFVTNDRIMPETVKKSVAKGPPSAIRARIDEALRAVGNSPLPGYQEPNPNWTGPSTMQAPRAPGNTRPPQYEQPVLQAPEQLTSIEQKLWF